VNNRELIRGRQKARKYIVQALYQWHMNTTDVIEIQAQFLTINDPQKFDSEYFTEMLSGITKDSTLLDEKITACLDRPLTMLNPVELAVLRLSTYEFLNRLDIPFKVVIDEAIALCKTYGAVEGHRYVNGVLHRLATELRSVEIQHHAKGVNDEPI
jgi:N utilization substance protein B